MYKIPLVIMWTLLHSCESARILGFFTTASISHHQTSRSICKELALRGHEVTMITPNILNEPNLPNLIEIDIKQVYNLHKIYDVSKTLSKNLLTIEKVLNYFTLCSLPTEIALQNDEVQKLIQSDKVFDLLIVQAFHPIIFSMGAKFKVPIIGLSSYGVLLNMHDAIGNPTHPVISPDLLFTYDHDIKFLVKVNSFLYNIWYRMLYYWYELPKSDKIARKYFGEDIPYLGDIVNNVSLIMVNVNPILTSPRANVPNIIEINQIHIKKSQPLSEDIKKYLDSSTNGAVYFSLGSNVKSSNLPIKTRNQIIDALAELPYNVLWKWETDHLPGQPKNVMVRKWLPQQDVLGHPNIKVFVTQGGLQSAEETIVKGVPIVGIPFIADQPQNVKKMVEKGLGKGIEAEFLTKDALRDAIIEVAENKSYKEAVLKAQKILQDQPIKGLDKAVWWIEYVLRHGDVSHLKSVIY